jgi:cytidyltransferase-like protein
MYKVTKRNRLMALGGTFDHLHIGHHSFISYAFTYAQRLVIGVTDDSFAKSKSFPESLQPYKVRARAVRMFCKKHNIPHEIVPLSDPYGPTIEYENNKIDSLCVTPETLGGAEKINEVRNASGMRELPVFIAPLVDNDQGKPLHAIQIRAGKVNREGLTYTHAFTKDIEINKKQRHFLSNPLGPVVRMPTHKRKTIIAVVGDYALSQFIENDWTYTIGVYDKLTKREPYSTDQLKNLRPTHTITNPAGLISTEALQVVSHLSYDSVQHILVNGEEDLVTVALILTMPLESIIYYGQPNEGMVLLKITEEFKERIYRLLTD